MHTHTHRVSEQKGSQLLLFRFVWQRVLDKKDVFSTEIQKEPSLQWTLLIFTTKKLLKSVCSLSHTYVVPQINLYLSSDSMTWGTKDRFDPDLFQCLWFGSALKGAAIECCGTAHLVNHNRPFHLRQANSQVKTFLALHWCQNVLLLTLTQSFVSKGACKRETISPSGSEVTAIERRSFRSICYGSRFISCQIRNKFVAFLKGINWVLSWHKTIKKNGTALT